MLENCEHSPDVLLCNPYKPIFLIIMLSVIVFLNIFQGLGPFFSIFIGVIQMFVCFNKNNQSELSNAHPA